MLNKTKTDRLIKASLVEDGEAGKGKREKGNRRGREVDALAMCW